MASADAVRSDLIHSDTTPENPLKGITIRAALDEYMASVGNEIAPAVADQYRLVIGKLIEFCLRRSVPVHYMSELTVDILESFASKAYKNKASTTQAVAMAKVKALLNDAFRRGWVKEPLAKRMKKYTGQYQQPLYCSGRIGQSGGSKLSQLDHAANCRSRRKSLLA